MSHQVDRNTEIMFIEHGTKCLITDPAADRLLAKASNHGKERYAKWCGGKGGFDDFAERLH